MMKTGQVALIRRHPWDELIGIYAPGDAVEIELSPFRAALFEIAEIGEAYPVLAGCWYETVKENADGTPVEVKMLSAPGGEVTLLKNGQFSPYGTFPKTDRQERAPQYLGTMSDDPTAVSRGEELYEAAQFGLDNDSLESRERRRSGPTSVPEVQAARDAFFAQKTYRTRGCEGRFAFDGDPDTYFDG